MLVAFLLYNDGIQTMIKMSSIYGAEAGIDANAQIAAFVLVQFVGIPFSFLFGALAGRIGAKPAMFLSLVVYTIVSIIGYFLSQTWHFFALAFLVGTVQGGSQGLSRSLFARMIPQGEVVGVFRLLLGLREVRADLRAAGVCGGGHDLRQQPERGPVGDSLLHRSVRWC